MKKQEETERIEVILNRKVNQYGQRQGIAKVSHPAFYTLRAKTVRIYTILNEIAVATRG